SAPPFSSSATVSTQRKPPPLRAHRFYFIFVHLDMFGDYGRGEGGTAAVIGGGISFRLETEDVDAAVKMAVAAGAEVVSEVAEDESGVVVKLKDPFGVVWVVSAAVGNKTLDAEAEA
ncbi:hypothetical protein GW17_00023413, partial [Ensete ventricosum]